MKILVAILGALALSSQTRSGPAPSGIIRGRVVAAGFEIAPPIQGARSSGPGAIDPVFTDGSGRFEITGLAGGHYTLTAEKTGFARTRS